MRGRLIRSSYVFNGYGGPHISIGYGWRALGVVVNPPERVGIPHLWHGWQVRFMLIWWHFCIQWDAPVIRNKRDSCCQH